ARRGRVALHALLGLLRIVDALLLAELLRLRARERLERLGVLLLLPLAELVAALRRVVTVLALRGADVVVDARGLRGLRRRVRRDRGEPDRDERTCRCQSRRHSHESHRDSSL